MSAAAFTLKKASSADAGEVLGRLAVRVLMVILVIPTHDVLTRAWEAGAPWSDVIAVLAAALTLGWLGARSGSSPFARFRYPLLAVVGVMLVSALVNQLSWSQAAEGLRAMLPWMVLGLASAAVFRPEHVPGVLRLATILGAVVAGYGILSFMTFRSVLGPGGLPEGPRTLWDTVMLYPYYCGAYPVPGGWRLVSTFMNDNYLGVWLVMLAAATFGLTVTEERQPFQIAGYAALAVMLVAFTWTYSRAAVLALLVAVVVLTWKVTWRAPLLLLPVLVAAPLYLFPVDVYRFRHVGATDGGRIASAQRTAESLKERFWLGHGPGTRGLADLNYAKIGYETGALGLAAFAWLLFSAVRPALTRVAAPAETARLRGALLAGMAGMAAAAVGGEVWETPQLAFYFWMLAGLASVLASPQPLAVEG